VGGTQMLIWRLFREDPDLVVVSGVKQRDLVASDDYTALAAPTLYVPYPRLRGYRYGLAPALGALSGAWLAGALVRVVRFLRAHRVEHVVSIPHYGPFALVGLLAARRLGIAHTMYILDAWEEAATGPIERSFVRWGLRLAARMPRSRLAVVSPALGVHYQEAFGFRDVTWIPNPSPLSAEPVATKSEAAPYVLFTGAIKPFNIEAVRCVARAIGHCRAVRKLILTGHSAGIVDALRAPGAAGDRIEVRLCSAAEIAALQRQASVLLVATNVDDTSQTSRGYLPGRLPEYVSVRRPILLIGPEESDASRAVRHWRLGLTTISQDETAIAALLDTLASQAGNDDPRRPATDHGLFLEVFSRQEARRRLLGEASAPLSDAASVRAAEFEQPLRGGPERGPRGSSPDR